tara:strand:- start:1419 stop:1922 length:504 start_codon:yes stop_codon:yes gene_type:complete
MEQHPYKIIQNAAAFIVFISFLTLLTVLVSQYVFGLNPCHLCIYQRIPYVIAIALGLIAYGAARQDKEIGNFFLALTGATFLAGFGLAVFHVGVEQKWWAGLESCSLSDTGQMSIEELREQILKAPVVRCDEAAFTFLGLSMAAYNAILSFALAVFTLFSLKKGLSK